MDKSGSLRLKKVKYKLLLKFNHSILLLLAILLLPLLLTGCGGDVPPGADLSLSPDFQKFERSHFGFFRALSSYPFVSEMGIHWERPHPGPFIWGEIEGEEGAGYDFSEVDGYIRESQRYGILTVATIWPYANWDQERCHERLPDSPRRLFSILGDYRGKPCDPDAYEQFVRALVERYDGDGIDDMPGIVYPIKYWEVSNEPDIAEGSVFFKGDAQADDYLELLDTTNRAIREADPSARVLNGGIAFMRESEKPFWRTVLGEAGGKIDAVTLHSITMGPDLQLPALNELMDELGLNRPVWITEIQFAKSRAFLQARGLAPEVAGGPAMTEDEWAVHLVKSFVEAFGNGADKLFYLGLDNTTPTDEASLLVNCRIAEGAVRGDPFDPELCDRQKTFFALKTMTEKIDYFDAADKLAEGRFRFTIGDRAVYALWGSGPLPDGLTGPMMVTDISGGQSQVPAGSLVLTDKPVFVEESGR